MESSTILPLSHLCILNHKPQGHGTTTIGVFPFKQWKQRSAHMTHLNCQKMHVSEIFQWKTFITKATSGSILSQTLPLSEII
ncbi:hypothetical protein OSB04_002603 [Centaurea solstitialis]|uniref:Uncharacterized protein n=1 Tax=Centaurea solstitialis TaxID=347529 RepID=A0AA38UAW9_9ASTR|nr:hypothetical protein OSB04_002603 [Centaurea solstitialis]